MTGPICSSHRLTSQGAAVFVTAPGSSRFFIPFLARERTVGDVAAELGVSIGALRYRVGQMVDLGLIACVRVQARAGRPVRHYRSTADDVFAPLDLTPLDSVRQLFAHARSQTRDALEAGIEQAWLGLVRDQDWGTRLYRPTPDAGVNRDFVPASLAGADDFWAATLAPTAPPVWDQYAELRLDRQQAKRLQRELAELVEKHTTPAQDRKGSRRYLIHLALAEVGQ